MIADDWSISHLITSIAGNTLHNFLSCRITIFLTLHNCLGYSLVTVVCTLHGGPGSHITQHFNNNNNNTFWSTNYVSQPNISDAGSRVPEIFQLSLTKDCHRETIVVICVVVPPKWWSHSKRDSKMAIVKILQPKVAYVNFLNMSEIQRDYRTVCLLLRPTSTGQPIKIQQEMACLST